MCIPIKGHILVENYFVMGYRSHTCGNLFCYGLSHWWYWGGDPHGPDAFAAQYMVRLFVTYVRSASYKA